MDILKIRRGKVTGNPAEKSQRKGQKSWTVPDGMFLCVTNRSTNLFTSLVTIYTKEDSSNVKQLAVGAQAFYRVKNLNDLVITGDTIGMVLELDAERK